MNDRRDRTIAPMSPCDECGCPNPYDCGCQQRRQERLFPVDEPVVNGDKLAAEIEAWLTEQTATQPAAPKLTLARRTVVIDGTGGVTGQLFAGLMHAASAPPNAISLEQLPAILGLADLRLATLRHGDDERSLASFEIEGDPQASVGWDELFGRVDRAWLPADCTGTVSGLLRHCRSRVTEPEASVGLLVAVSAGVVCWHYAGRPAVVVSGKLELGLSGDARALPPLAAQASRPGCFTDLAGAALLNAFWQPATPSSPPALQLTAAAGYGAQVARGALHLGT